MMIKFNTTPKANGTPTPKTAKDSAAKSAKPKVKKVPKPVEPEVVAAPPEPELSPEEKRVKKEAGFSIHPCIRSLTV